MPEEGHEGNVVEQVRHISSLSATTVGNLSIADTIGTQLAVLH